MSAAESTDTERVVTLTEAQMDKIAERAAKKVFETIYAEVGRGVLRKLMWAIGVATITALAWAAGRAEFPK